ncbi:hypothetical protein ACTPOK_01010 [Streptomyces inhibens]|uniref:hypothetical protein n=1 Tax=Streptomyces inhibens TaxID=2293571 RepID=UPI00402AA6DE
MTTPQCGPLEDAPLEQLFPDAGEGDLELIRLAAAQVDAARAPKFPVLWEWEAGVLYTDVTVYDEADDRLEFLLQVDCSEDVCPHIFVSVCVACGCEKNHETHFLDEVPVFLTELTSLYEGAELGMAFSLAAGQLVSWIEDPRDPSYWRSLRGLPAPRSASPSP